MLAPDIDLGSTIRISICDVYGMGAMFPNIGHRLTLILQPPVLVNRFIIDLLSESEMSNSGETFSTFCESTIVFHTGSLHDNASDAMEILPPDGCPTTEHNGDSGQRSGRSAAWQGCRRPALNLNV